MRGQKSRSNRGRKPPNSPDGRNNLPNPQYLGRYPVVNPPQRNPEPGSPNIPNNPDGCNGLSNPQYIGPYLVTKPPNSLDGRTTLTGPQYIGPYLVTNPLEGKHQPGSPSVLNNSDGRNTLSDPHHLGPYLVTKPPKGNPQPGSPSVLNTKKHNTQPHPRKIASRPAANTQKGEFGKGRPQNDGTHAVAYHPGPQLKRREVFDPRGLQPSVYRENFRTPNPSPTAIRLASYLLREVNQERPALSHRYSTGELPICDKLANTSVMGIPKHRFGAGERRDSTASAAPVMTAEYCGDPYRTTIRERLAAGKPRAPPGSGFELDSRNYHMAGKSAEMASIIHDCVEPGYIKQAMSNIAGMGYAIAARLRITMGYRWVGYDEFDTYPGHCQAIEYNKGMMMEYIGEAMPTMAVS